MVLGEWRERQGDKRREVDWGLLGLGSQNFFLAASLLLDFPVPQ